MRQTLAGATGIAGVGFLLLGVWWFVDHSVGRGLGVTDPAERAGSRLFHAGDWSSTLAIYGHMVLGGLLTFLAPLQLLGIVRRRLPALHRMIGYGVTALALGTAIGGLVYIARQGTIGGPWMSAGFALYGLLLGIAAVQTVRLARRRDPAHRDWALRLVVLALGSWIFRLHYALWDLATGGAGTNEAFTGIFDRAQVVAFYLPYLAGLELYLRRPARALRTDHSLRASP